VHHLLADPWIAAKVEAAVAPYAGRLSEEDIAWMRDQLAATLASNERASRLLGRARPPILLESGEVRREGAAVIPLDAAARKPPKAAG
jgi:hypothetical protein